MDALHQATVRAAPRRPDALDRAWNFFASVRVATVIIFVIALASVAGSLVEQEGQYASALPPDQFYPLRYGPVLGTLLWNVGLTRAFTSWWYLGLLLMMAASLVICSLDRFVPLSRMVHQPNLAPVPAFLARQKYRQTCPAGLAAVAGALRSRGYRVQAAGHDRLFAERGRWGRWGPYITHVGLLVILAGAMLRAVPGFYLQDSLWIPDGGTARVPGTDWYVTSERFVAEYYPDGRPKLFATHAVVVDNGQVAARHTIRLNEPLRYKQTELYQSSFRSALATAELALLWPDGSEAGRFTVDLAQPLPEYRVGPVTLKIRDYFPDFDLDEQNLPVSRTGNPENPAFLFMLATPGLRPLPLWLVVNFPNIDLNPGLPFRLTTVHTRRLATTGLMVKKDLGVPVVYTGLGVVMLGLCLTFYLSHRRIWAMATPAGALVAGQTNRNHGDFRREFAALAGGLGAAPRNATDTTVHLPEGEEP